MEWCAVTRDYCAADGVAAAPPGGAKTPPESLILRFLPGERFLHWALAGPFVLLYLSAGLMFLFYGEPSPRQFRTAFSIAHRTFGVLLIVLPPLALLRGNADWRVHLENMREGWRWTAADIRWLLLFPRNALNPEIALPEQGKFNAAEKLNFMMVSTCYPLYIITGILVWLPGVAIVSYLAHYAMAVVGVPLVLGHIFMATIAPDTKVGLSGMITGQVDRSWAKHHYRRWYREQFELPGAGLGFEELRADSATTLGRSEREDALCDQPRKQDIQGDIPDEVVGHHPRHDPPTIRLDETLHPAGSQHGHGFLEA